LVVEAVLAVPAGSGVVARQANGKICIMIDEIAKLHPAAQVAACIGLFFFCSVLAYCFF
jgi:hypothetical protein